MVTMTMVMNNRAKRTKSAVASLLAWFIFLGQGPTFTFAQEGSNTTTPASCDQCFFTPEDADDCRVYGKIDGRLVSWEKASADCLNSYNIKNTGIDPFSVGCDPLNTNTFVNNGLRGGALPNSVLAGLGVSEGGFFGEQNQAGQPYDLKEFITIDGSTMNCEASPSTCYIAMRDYFASGSGAQEMKNVCTTIINQQARDRELEQSAVRNRICQDIKVDTAPPTTCGALVGEVQSAMVDAPTKDCPGFAFGPGTTVAPGCAGGGGDSSSATAMRSTVMVGLTIALMLTLA